MTSPAPTILRLRPCRRPADLGQCPMMALAVGEEIVGAPRYRQRPDCRLELRMAHRQSTVRHHQRGGHRSASLGLELPVLPANARPMALRSGPPGLCYRKASPDCLAPRSTFPLPVWKFPVAPRKFPIRSHRENGKNCPGNPSVTERARACFRHSSRKFPVYSLFNR